MKKQFKEVPPFGVLSADYDPSTHVIVRSNAGTSSRPTELPRGKTEEHTNTGETPVVRRSTETRSNKSMQLSHVVNNAPTNK